jgi:hypothetical protein
MDLPTILREAEAELDELRIAFEAQKRLVAKLRALAGIPQPTVTQFVPQFREVAVPKPSQPAPDEATVTQDQIQELLKLGLDGPGRTKNKQPLIVAAPHTAPV